MSKICQIYVSNVKWMSRIYRKCQRYVEQLSKGSENVKDMSKGYQKEVCPNQGSIIFENYFP